MLCKAIIIPTPGLQGTFDDHVLPPGAQSVTRGHTRAKQDVYCCHKYNSDSLFLAHSTVEDLRSWGENEMD